jgi:acyl-lipid omega-3 desaturase
MWKDSPSSEYVKCLGSTLFVIAWATGVFHLCDYNFGSFFYFYLAPVLVFGWWLVTVTYLQHHAPDTLVHDDSTWKFVDAAFETVDRQYGPLIDSLSHHITDGHVVHHLFFTKIPHYHLARATAAMKAYLEEVGAIDLYKHEQTHDFFFRVHHYFISHGLRAVLYRPPASSPQTVAASTSSPTLAKEAKAALSEGKKIK